jgi:hypothetical protein
MAAVIPIAFQLAAAYLIPAGSSLAVSGLIMGGAALLGGYVASELFGGRDARDQLEDVRSNYVSANKTIPIVYGKRLIGSNDVFAEAGTKGELGDNKGSYFWVVHVLCEGEIEGVSKIEVDGVMWDDMYIGGEPLHKMDGDRLARMKYWVYTGTGSQTVNEQLFRGTRKDSQDKYTDALRHVAYIVFRFEQGKKGFTSIPSREVVIKGKLCFDPRTSEVAWTNNPALILYDYITHPRYGLNWDKDLLYTQSFNETATYCDTGDIIQSVGTVSTGVTFDIFVLSNETDYDAIKEGDTLKVEDGYYNVIEKIGASKLIVSPPPGIQIINLPFLYFAPRWALNYVVATPIKSQTIIDTILGHFRGALYWGNAILYLRYLDLKKESTNFAIKDEHVARDQDGKAMVSVSQPSRFNTPEGAIVSFINARDNWVIDRISVGERLGQIKTIDFVGFTDRHFAHEMGLYVLERQRLGRTFTLVLRADTVALDTNDLVELTISELSLTGQLARIKTNDIGGGGLITVTAVLEAEELYNDVFDPDTAKIYNVDLPSIDTAPPSVKDVYVIEETYFYRERSFVRLNVYFSPPDNYPWFSHVDVYVGFPAEITTEAVGTLSTGGTTDIFVLSEAVDYAAIYEGYQITIGSSSFEVIQKLGSLSLLVFPAGSIRVDDPFSYVSPEEDPDDSDYLYRFPANDSFALDPVGESQTYYIRLNSVSTQGVVQDNGSAAHVVHTVLGVSDIYPPCPTYLDIAVNLTSIDIISNVIPNPDISGYEIRLGTTWFSAIFIIFRGSPSVSFSGVKPGLHRFWLNTKHKNGIYCQNPMHKEALIEEPPPGAHLFFTHLVDYLQGTPTNMDVTSSSLRVNHAGGNLVGELITDVIDTGNQNLEQKMIIYVSFDFSLSGGTNSWNNLAPTPFDWYDFAFDQSGGKWKTWYELLGDFRRSEAAKVEVGVDYSTTAAFTTYESVERLELLSAIVTGRYIRIRYKIIDTNNISFITIGASSLKASYLEDTLLIDA